MTGHRATRPRGADEGGIVLIEFAIVALFLFILSAGAFDYGMAWRSSLAINEASRTGARVGSAMGNERLADYYALSGAKAALESSGRLAAVERVVIFRAASDDGVVPTQCKTATSTTAACNILDGDTFRSAWTESNFHATTGCFVGSSLPQRWCPVDRENVQLNADYFGIWIDYRYDHMIRLIDDQTTVTRQTVMRIEPEGVRP